MVRALLLCLALPACLVDDEEPPDPPAPTFEAIFTVTAPSSFDALTMDLPDLRQESVRIDPPGAEYVWDYSAAALPASVHMIAYFGSAIVAYGDASLTYSLDQTPSGTFTLELHP